MRNHYIIRYELPGHTTGMRTLAVTLPVDSPTPADDVLLGLQRAVARQEKVSERLGLELIRFHLISLVHHVA